MKAFLFFSLALLVLSIFYTPTLGKPFGSAVDEDDENGDSDAYYPEAGNEADKSGEIDDGAVVVDADSDDEVEDDQYEISRKKRSVGKITSDEADANETAGNLHSNGEIERPIDEEENNYGEDESDKEIAEAQAVDVDQELDNAEKNEEEPANEDDDKYVEAVEETPQTGDDGYVQVPEETPQDEDDGYLVVPEEQEQAEEESEAADGTQDEVEEDE